MNKVFYTLAWITIISAMGLILLVSFWYLYPYRILEFKDEKFPMVTKQAKQGGFLIFRSRFCKYMDLPSETSGSFINGIIFNVPTVTTNRDVGCGDIRVQINVPKELPTGPIHFQRIYRFKVNPLRTITYTHNTEMFQITESSESAELRLQKY